MSSDGRLGIALEQADLQVLRPIYGLAIGPKPAVGNAEDEFRAEHPLEVDAVFDQPGGRQHHAGEFQFANRGRPPAAGGPDPAEEEAEELPQRVETETAGHHRIALEVAGGEPERGGYLGPGAGQGPARLAGAP